MICEAETKAACSVQSPENGQGEYAHSILAPFDLISKLVDLSVPLRRPNRTGPLPTLQQELSAWDAASDEAWDSIDE